MYDFVYYAQDALVIVLKQGKFFVFLIALVLIILCSEHYRNSIKNLKNKRKLINYFSLMFLNLILGKFFFTMKMCDNVRIYFNFIITSFVSMFYGPLYGGAFGFSSEILEFVFSRQSQFMPIIFINSMCASLIYGMFLYDRDFVFWRVFLAKLSNTLLINIFLNSIGLVNFMDENLCLWLPIRIAKNIFLFVFETLILYLSLKIFVFLTSKKEKKVYNFGSVSSGQTF